jgi:DNA-binding NarL/FixJ family response regulator
LFSSTEDVSASSQSCWVRLITRGKANKLIALELGVSERTVKTHVSHILGKLGLSDRTQAALWAVREGLVAPGQQD